MGLEQTGFLLGREGKFVRGDGSVPSGWDGHGSEHFIWLLGKLRQRAFPWWQHMRYQLRDDVSATLSGIPKEIWRQPV